MLSARLAAVCRPAGVGRIGLPGRGLLRLRASFLAHVQFWQAVGAHPSPSVSARGWMRDRVRRECL